MLSVTLHRKRAISSTSHSTYLYFTIVYNTQQLVASLCDASISKGAYRGYSLIFWIGVKSSHRRLFYALLMKEKRDESIQRRTDAFPNPISPHHDYVTHINLSIPNHSAGSQSPSNVRSRSITVWLITKNHCSFISKSTGFRKHFCLPLA